MFNESDYENEISEWKNLKKELRSCEGLANISEEMITEVLIFLVELAKLEIKMIEMGIL